MPYKAAAPGSLMLLGEYAVLHGKPALVCAIDKRITVVLTPRSDQRIEIQSATHGHYTTDLTQLKIERPFQFVLAVLKRYQTKLKRGCHLDITTEFSDQIGLGSSAAVTVATLATIVSWLNIRISPLDLIRQARHVVRDVQGIGSGADVAAAVYGGMVAYQAQPLSAEKLAATHPLTVLYAGFKTPTVAAIKQVKNNFSTCPKLFHSIITGIGECAQEGIQFVRKEEWSKLGKIMNIQQGMMEALGVSMPLLNNMIEGLRQRPSILGAKISGAGLGDCVIGLGEYENSQRIPLMMTTQGVQCEKI